MSEVSIPRPANPAHQIGEVIYKGQPMTLADVKSLRITKSSDASFRSFINDWVARGWFYFREGKVGLTIRAKNYYAGLQPNEADKAILALPRVIDKLHCKPYTPPKVYRREPLRQISFVTFSVHEVAA